MNYELSVTFKCNWNCDYCISNTHSQSEKVLESVLDEIRNLPDDVKSVTISGGEPGMLSKDNLGTIISMLKERDLRIDLMTNGLFFKNHPEFLQDLDEIFYHVVEDLSSKKDFKLYANIMNKDNRYYVLVAINESLKNIQYYIDNYPEIKFLILGDYRGSNMIKIKEFLKFISYNKDRINKRTLIEFNRNISRI